MFFYDFPNRPLQRQQHTGRESNLNKWLIQAPMVAYWKVYDMQNRTTNDRSTEKSMSFHLVYISLYKNATGAGCLQLSHLSFRTTDQMDVVVWHNMKKRSIQRQTQWRTKTRVLPASHCAIVQLGRMVAGVELAPITLPALVVCLTSGTTGAGAKGELWALSSGPEALSSKLLLRALSDFEAVRWEANLIS